MHSHRTLAWLTWLIIVLLHGNSAPAADDNALPQYNRDIRPLLAKHCFACHGPDPDSREADLRLDLREAALSGNAIQPGKPAASELIRRVTTRDPDLRMPPPDTGEALTDAEAASLRAWIAGGAEYQQHWSFVPPERAELPNVSQSDWALAPWDAFVLAELERRGLQPAAEADRAMWLRRVSLDLTGLPPTWDDADAFLADSSSDAYEKVVDRLLASEAYGERWARMWLDLARYADTKGYEKDRHRDIWRYRDWVIDALNNDMPFDQFTREQLAGDLLPNRTTEQILATAFHRNTMTNEEGGTDNEEFRVAAVKDRVDTTIQVWMGLTMGCAKCHSHKYDPITNRDYYAFYSFFNQTQDADAEAPLWPTPTPQLAQKIAAQEAVVRELRLRAKKSKENKSGKNKNKDEPVAKGKEEEGGNKDQEKSQQEASSAELKAAEAKLKQLKGRVPRTPVLLELDPQRRRQTRIHNRGNFLDQGEPVKAEALTVFGRLPDDAPRNRLGVAQWLMQPENPLTSRVMVNRVWARLFGVGLVATEEDFGAQGAAPSHPQLLDWLALDFREHWSLKRLLKSLVLSRTYRQSSSVAGMTAEQLAQDPQNRWLSRGPRFRLSAEMVRDQALAVSGLLHRRVGGPSVMPPQPDGIWKSTYNGQKWVNAEGPDRYRRGLYTYLKRTSPYPALTTFDAGSGEVCQIRRVRTNTPLQALVTLNDEAFVEAAGALAARMSAAEGPLEQQVAHGFRRVLIRQPSPEEVQRLVELYQQVKSQLADPQQLLEAAGLQQGDAAMVAVANVLLNLDETLMKP